MKKITALFVAIACMLGLASCGNTSWVVKYNDTSVSDELYIGYLVLAYQQAAYQLQSSGSASSGADLLSQKIDDTDASTWIKDTALDMVFNHLASDELAKELHYEWPKEQLDEVVSTAQQAYASTQYGSFSANGVSQETFVEMYQNSALQEQLFNAIYGESGAKAVPEEDIKGYFNDNFMSVKIIEIQTVDSSGKALAQEELDKTKAKLEGYAARYNKGAPMDELTLEYNKENETLSEGQESSAKASESLLLSKDATQYAQYPQVAKLIDAVQKMDVNTAQFVDASSSYFFVEKLPLEAKESDYTDNKSSFLSMLKGEEFTADMKSRAETVESKSDLNKASLKRYTPNKLTMS